MPDANRIIQLFNRIQITTDKVMIDNGKSMKGIMEATQREATSSRLMANAQQQLTEDMKEDGVAMKTVSIQLWEFSCRGPSSDSNSR